jgi:cell division protein ZapA
MALDNIEQLEAKIDRLIEKHEKVRREKESIEKKLQQKESEWHHLKGQLRQYERERMELREKLDKILGHFDSLDLTEWGGKKAMKRAVDVEILGQKFTISSDADETHMLKVADYVDGKMQELLRSSKALAKSNIGMLAALNIADEYHRLKESHETILHKVSQLSKKLATTLTEEG